MDFSLTEEQQLLQDRSINLLKENILLTTERNS